MRSALVAFLLLGSLATQNAGPVFQNPWTRTFEVQDDFVTGSWTGIGAVTYPTNLSVDGVVTSRCMELGVGAIATTFWQTISGSSWYCISLDVMHETTAPNPVPGVGNVSLQINGTSVALQGAPMGLGHVPTPGYIRRHYVAVYDGTTTSGNLAMQLQQIAQAKVYIDNIKVWRPDPWISSANQPTLFNGHAYQSGQYSIDAPITIAQQFEPPSATLQSYILVMDLALTSGLPIAGFVNRWCLTGGGLTVDMGVTGGTINFTTAGYIPNNPALAGIAIYTQAVVSETASSGGLPEFLQPCVGYIVNPLAP